MLVKQEELLFFLVCEIPEVFRGNISSIVVEVFSALTELVWVVIIFK
jgi:hypothetical protein